MDYTHCRRNNFFAMTLRLNSQNEFILLSIQNWNVYFEKKWKMNKNYIYIYILKLRSKYKIISTIKYGVWGRQFLALIGFSVHIYCRHHKVPPPQLGLR